MKVVRAEFRTEAQSAASLPRARLPEIAIAGRSNVGKSSLINALTGRRGLARISVTPGRTRGLIFFEVNESLLLVDLPGYGYARRSQAERREWKTLVEAYLGARKTLAGVVVLVDVRRGPEQEERDLAAYLDHHQIGYLWVVTKCDKLSRARLDRRLHELEQDFGDAPMLAVSSRTGGGVSGLWKWIEAATNDDSHVRTT